MALEDFFTLTEMKDGLTAPARVKELIKVLEKDKHNTVKNVTDITRQWSAVASTIASTENEECLTLFLQLDGLCYFDTWLKHGQKCLQESGDIFIEESMIVLLGAIEKLYREGHKSVISGIMMTLKEFLGNNSSRVQNSARALYDSWKQNDEINAVQNDVDKDEVVCNNVVDVNGNHVSKHEQPECSSQDISTLGGINSEEKDTEPARNDITPAIRPETMQTEVVVDLTIRPSDKTSSRHDASSDPVHSCTLKLLRHNISVVENPSQHQLEATTGTNSSGSAVSEPMTLEGQLDVANSNEHDEAKQMLLLRSCNNLGSTGTFCADSANTMESKVGADNEKDVDVEKGDPCLTTNSSGDVRMEESEGIEEMYDSIFPNPCSKISTSDGTVPVDVLDGSSINELNMKKNECVTSNTSRIEGPEAIEESDGQNVSNEVEIVWENVDLTANSSRKEDIEAIEPIELSNGQNVSDKDEVSWENVDLTRNFLRKEDAEAVEEPSIQYVSDVVEVRENDPEISMSGADWKHSVEKKSDLQFGYDMFDPLEVARQVAIEVEREVDCREPSCSSSERMSGGGIRLPESPDSMKGKNSKVIHRPGNDVSTGPNLSAVVGDDVFNKVKNLHSVRENSIVNIEPTEVSEVAQNVEPDENKHVCGFDLNEDVLSDDDMDNQTNRVTAPISLVSALMAAATSGLPLSPLQFDRTRAWNGSAITSAFPPAPMHVSERQNFISAAGSSSSLFQRQVYLDFDLNNAESEDDKISDLPPSKATPNSTARPSGECSLESRSKRCDLLQLDLNYVSDSGDASLSYWRKEERDVPHYNSQFSPPVSSSSSSKQPSLKNIDLNDQPSPFTEFLHPALTAKSSPNLSTSGSGGFKTNESVISLMGVRVEVGQNDNFPRTIPLLNGRIMDPALDASMTRNGSVLGLASSSSLYAQSYMYGYNGPLSGPTLPHTSNIYGLGGRIPYMVDSRGNPVVPQVLGPVPTLSPSMQQPSFFESLVTRPTDPYGFVPSRHGFDLNSGLMIEGRNRDSGNIMQGISMDEQMRDNSQSTSSFGVGGKRKETDGGLDPYPFLYKHHQPPWK